MTHWSQEGFIILDETITEKAGDDVPGVGHFYDHAEGDTVWGQDIVYAFYADDKTAYPLTFRLYEQQDEDDEDHDTKYNLAREIVTELEEEVGVPAATYLFDSWFAHSSDLPEHIESYGKDWSGPLRSNRQVTTPATRSASMRWQSASTRPSVTSRTIPITYGRRS